MGGDAEEKELAEADAEEPAGAMVEVLAACEVVGPVIEKAKIPQAGEDDVVQESGVGRGEGRAAGGVIEEVDGVAGCLLPGIEDIECEVTDVGGAGFQRLGVGMAREGDAGRRRAGLTTVGEDATTDAAILEAEVAGGDGVDEVPPIKDERGAHGLA